MPVNSQVPRSLNDERWDEEPGGIDPADQGVNEDSAVDRGRPLVPTTLGARRATLLALGLGAVGAATTLLRRGGNGPRGSVAPRSGAPGAPTPTASAPGGPTSANPLPSAPGTTAPTSTATGAAPSDSPGAAPVVAPWRAQVVAGAQEGDVDDTAPDLGAVLDAEGAAWVAALDASEVLSAEEERSMDAAADTPAATPGTPDPADTTDPADTRGAEAPAGSDPGAPGTTGTAPSEAPVVSDGSTTSPVTSPSTSTGSVPAVVSSTAWDAGDGTAFAPAAGLGAAVASTPEAAAVAPLGLGGQAVVSQATTTGFAATRALAVYRRARPQATVTAVSELAPGLTLRTTPAWHLARRASTAATAEIAAEIEARGTTAWIDWQLNPSRVNDSRAEQIIATHFPWAAVSGPALTTATGGKPYLAPPMIANSIFMRARFGNRVLADAVAEMMADMVYVPLLGKAQSMVTGLDTILRTRSLGRYADLLLAALTDPALLRELDNTVSTKNSPNENLGRELLELYTVGRDAYTEDDVKGATIMLTGHGVDWTTRTYLYSPKLHATGTVKILGFSDPNTDAAQGPDLLKRCVEYLCAHQATATRIATRIARRFISDNPSDAVIAAIARAYLDNGTRIAPAVRVALTHKEFHQSVGKKWKRPTEVIMSIARAAGVESVLPPGRASANDVWNLGAYGWLVRDAGHQPRMYTSVDGYPDTAEYWMSTSRMMTMWNAVQRAVPGDTKESGRTDWVRALSITAGDSAKTTAERITWHLTGYVWDDSHLESIARILAGMPMSGGLADWKVVSNHLSGYVEQAVRLTYASPYGSLR
ncbi:MAG: DUF1800 family protein [Actinomyces sp.]|uniref:DUF1800 family protein n=1 Tax=Actinomyces sp. TaxID=29317 RepID=UPI0026DAFE92|nr:DUF1800 family protein [Actinomyces sp.]MDO4242892.1 DUF1800 family protein [Actinomyces sp.]